MNSKEHLLACLAEECEEVAHRIMKAFRFGISEVESGQPLSNAQRIAQEVSDLLAVLDMVEGDDIIDVDRSEKTADAKRCKVLKNMEYAKRIGAISD